MQVLKDMFSITIYSVSFCLNQIKYILTISCIPICLMLVFSFSGWIGKANTIDYVTLLIPSLLQIVIAWPFTYTWYKFNLSRDYSIITIKDSITWNRHIFKTFLTSLKIVPVAILAFISISLVSVIRNILGDVGYVIFIAYVFVAISITASVSLIIPAYIQAKPISILEALNLIKDNFKVIALNFTVLIILGIISYMSVIIVLYKLQHTFILDNQVMYHIIIYGIYKIFEFVLSAIYITYVTSIYFHVTNRKILEH